jgi:hypothetical protein
MIFYKDDKGSAAADGFDADGAGSRKQIQEARAFDVRPEDIKKGFAQHVACGAQSKPLQ